MSLIMLTVSPPRGKESKYLKSFKKHHKDVIDYVHHWVQESGKNGDHPHYHIVCTVPAGLAANKSRLIGKLPDRFSKYPFMIKVNRLTTKSQFNQKIGYCLKEPGCYVIQSNIDEEDFKQFIPSPDDIKINIRHGQKGTAIAQQIAIWALHYKIPSDKPHKALLAFTLQYPEYDIVNYEYIQSLVGMYMSNLEKQKNTGQTILSDYGIKPIK